MSTINIQADLFNSEAAVLRKKLYEAAITIPKNEANLLPLTHLDRKKIAYVQIGGGSGNQFDKTLKKYGEIRSFYMRRNFSPAERESLLRKLQDFDTVIIGLFGMSNRSSKDFGVSPAAKTLCRVLGEQDIKTILTVFGNPYSLKFFGAQQAVVVAYEEAPEAAQAAAKAIFGGIPVSGKLPVTASAQFQEGKGVYISKPIRFGFSLPEEEGMDSDQLLKIDSIAAHYVAKMAMPGCQILVLKGNNIVYDRAFGQTEYGRKGEKIDMIKHTYDLASLTKVAATTLSIMHLVEQGRVDLDAPITAYLPDLKGTDKATITSRRLLQHNAGLPAWAPLYLETFKEGSKKTLDPNFYSYYPTRSHEEAIAPNLYANAELKDWVWGKLKDIELKSSSVVRYSDIGMIYLGRIVEQVSGMSLDRYSNKFFFNSLGMNRSFFNPGSKGYTNNCPPTAADTKWRNAIIQGYVHDPTAAMMGGIAGHAGLFSNAYDLAKLLLMLKEGGLYANERYLKSATINYFTKKQLSKSRKGLGWDKPEYRPNRTHPTSDLASPETYGHTGFTGTCAWVDPTADIVYIFLSNRTFPYENNRMLLRENVRTQIMDQLYKSIQRYEEKSGA